MMSQPDWKRIIRHTGSNKFVPAPSIHSSLPPIPDPEAFTERKQLVEAALTLEPEAVATPTVSAVCAKAGVETVVFEKHFESREDVFPTFYDLAVDQYRMITEATQGYEDFTFEERLASFYYILLDTLGEQRAFVQATFDTRIRYNSTFRAEVRTALRSLLTNDRVPYANQLLTGTWPVHEVLTEVTFAIIRHWINDETEDQAATTALVDKLVAFIAELVTFRGVSTGVKLAWHLVQHDTLGLRRLPVVGWLFPASGTDSSGG